MIAQPNGPNPYYVPRTQVSTELMTFVALGAALAHCDARNSKMTALDLHLLVKEVRADVETAALPLGGSF